MPDFIAILNTDSSHRTIDVEAEIAGTDETNFTSLTEICFNKKYLLNVRAIRTIEICTTKKKRLFLPYLEKSIIQYPKIKIGGLKRTFPKIFSFFYTEISDEGKSILIDTCFKYFLNSNEEPAVRINCMQLIFDISKVIPEIKGKLQAAIEHIYDKSTASIRGRAHTILKKNI